ncbi:MULTISPECIES: heavy-metal-associated domain-containing protein [Achromobacter]|jgi:copper chaperone|uniref:Copper chaperone n=1 Tax=Alcaligenes xylosoxydans xylosoxydans TaxID=85698 RepID=A0A424WGV2_ALCXX|nr:MULTISPECIES: heavy-metal-associated domain-containing protein [Achromobacter]MBC9904252.1 heavy-metal-associated domain-containing protein [Achromobacter xylosoxidans]MBD0868867.1 heavy-metal-associated domain-containing protein [Achromobacter xylosoxidans]MDH1303197.1 heavy-metal-associated domain-containing protein [Achromobacter sp. GD03932]QNP88795.1 heavy-metal-associated domain-containing protein [Achromobacter xylosoxidans]RPJ92508.1 copper chaperone [Achromobacter xylosoxidans]
MSIEFQVADMTCGHCAKTITAAVNQAAPGATVTIDLPTHRVTVTGADDAGKIEDAIRDAGYQPLPV